MHCVVRVANSQFMITLSLQQFPWQHSLWLGRMNLLISDNLFLTSYFEDYTRGMYSYFVKKNYLDPYLITLDERMRKRERESRMEREGERERESDGERKAREKEREREGEGGREGECM